MISIMPQTMKLDIAEYIETYYPETWKAAKKMTRNQEAKATS